MPLTRVTQITINLLFEAVKWAKNHFNQFYFNLSAEFNWNTISNDFSSIFILTKLKLFKIITSQMCNMGLTFYTVILIDVSEWQHTNINNK